MLFKWFMALLTVTLVTTQANTSQAQTAEAPVEMTEGGWEFLVAPYVWFVSVEGDMTVKGQDASVDASFSDIWDNLNIGFFGHFEARKGPVAAFGDVIYADLEMSNSNGPLSIKTDMDLLIFDFGLAYEAARVRLSGHDTSKPVWLSVQPILGGRLYSVEGTLSPSRLPSVSASETWVDPVIGLRLNSDITPDWNVKLRGDVGGFGVASDLTWQALLAVGYNFGLFGEKDASVLLGYRAIYDDYETGSGADRFAIDATFHGPLLGMTLVF